MGCDIHLFTEVKINGTWYAYSHPRITRWYELFEKMAGVRGDVSNAIAPPRGLPADMSAVVKWSAERWVSDGHSHSLLDSREIAELIDWREGKLQKRSDRASLSWEWDELGYLDGNGWDKWHKYPGNHPKGIEDIRWVFWFDN
jgi:hypothetical protein